MRMTDHDSRQDCRVIPFVRPVTSEDNVVTSSIAAVIAVTILHHEGESPEERLLEIIEASGEAEVFDVADFFTVYFYLLVNLCGEYCLVLGYRTVLNHLRTC